VGAGGLEGLLIDGIVVEVLVLAVFAVGLVVVLPVCVVLTLGLVVLAVGLPGVAGTLLEVVPFIVDVPVVEAVPFTVEFAAGVPGIGVTPGEAKLFTCGLLILVVGDEVLAWGPAVLARGMEGAMAEGAVVLPVAGVDVLAAFPELAPPPAGGTAGAAESCNESIVAVIAKRVRV